MKNDKGASVKVLRAAQILGTALMLGIYYRNCITYYIVTTIAGSNVLSPVVYGSRKGRE